VNSRDAQKSVARPTQAARTSVVLASAKTDAIIEEMKTLTVRAHIDRARKPSRDKRGVTSISRESTVDGWCDRR